MARVIEPDAVKPGGALVSAALADPATHARLLNYTKRLVAALAFSDRRAEEIVSDAVAAALERAADYDPRRGSVVVWIIGFIHRIARQRRAKAERHRAHGDPQRDLAGLISREPPPGAAVEAASEWQTVRTALGTLAAVDRQLLEGRYYDDLTDAVLAEQTGLSRVNVRVRMHRAIQEVRRLLGPSQEGRP